MRLGTGLEGMERGEDLQLASLLPWLERSVGSQGVPVKIGG